jgi:glyoxylase-like metal-dependent hydrolase (beta-lactamase superfamily II)/rhodanese-related sulfurtransferase
MNNNQQGNSGLEIDATKLKEKLDKGEDVFILDVRTPEEYDTWRLSYDKHEKTPLIPVDRLFMSRKLIEDNLPKDKEIVTLCSHGNRSMMAAQMLSRMGYKVKSVKGGMSAWNHVYDATELSLPSLSLLGARVWQLRRISKGCMTYVVAAGNTATVIDSSCDISNSVLAVARENGLTITNVVDTHMHADHVSGMSMLARETGAKAHISAVEGYAPSSDTGVTPNPISDGHKIPVGNNVYLRAIHTPGHTDGSLCFALEKDGAQSNILFTGDTIFVNAVGRPDLRDKAQEFADSLYSTYQGKILTLPDETVILPAHFDTNTITPKHGEPITEKIGEAKKNIKVLSMNKEEFVKFMVSSVPPRPANYRTIISINKELLPCDQFNMGDLEAGPNSCAIRM